MLSPCASCKLDCASVSERQLRNASYGTKVRNANYGTKVPKEVTQRRERLMSTPAQAKTEQMVFRKTNVGVGRHISVTPGNSTNRHLAYGRIILNGSYPSDSFDTGDRETALICLSGTAAVHVDKESFQLGQYDSLYIPRDSHVD